MSAAYKKKLIEVALPLDEINKAAVKETANPFIKGHPKSLHIWWARRPLAAARAVLFASLVDDPSEHPEKYPTEAQQTAERDRLFEIIKRLVQWENSNNPDVLAEAKAAIRESCGDDLPPILDPFCGGGSIPLEAQRLGLEAHASDLNPVAVLITKAMIEIPPKFAGKPPVNPTDARKIGGGQNWPGATGLAADIRYYGQRMRDEAEKRIGHLYPKAQLPKEMGGGEATVIAWLWARTVTCPNPACGGQMPLVSSFDLSTKRGKAWVEPIVDQAAKTVRFTVKSGNGSAPPPPKISRGANFRCLICGSTADPQHLKDEGMAKRMGAQLMAIVAEGSQGRAYLSPSDEHSRIAFSAHASWRPEQDLPYEPRAIWCTLYGLTMHADLFTERQLVALTTFSDLVGEAQARVLADAIAAGLPNDGAPLHEGGTGAPAYAAAVATYLALTISRWADLSNSLCGWNSTNGNTRALFARQAIPMVWDFAEQNPFGRTGSFESTLQNCVDLMDRSPSSSVSQAEVQQLNATALSADREFAICTDPPYYDNIGYADLSDFFYVWLRRSLRAVHPDLFKTMLVPKSEELVASPYRHGGSKGAAEAFFEKGLGEAFDVMRVIQSLEFPMAVYYAYKQSEQVDDGADGIQASTGWETMLSGLLGSGFEITGTWPMRTERAARSVGLHTNALASSIIIVCRPRHETAEVVSRGQFIAALRRELPDALIRLQQGNIAPVDLQQSVIGPGMAVYSRYARVENADGTPVKIRAALQIINAELDAFLDNQIGELDSDTAFCVKWFEQYQFNPGRFGDADNLARARNTSASGLQAAGVLALDKGNVRLRKRDELNAKWDPATDRRSSVWESLQHVIRAFEAGGSEGAGQLLAKLGPTRQEQIKELAYRLYTTCDKQGWTTEAQAYDGLVRGWSDIRDRADAAPTAARQTSFAE